MNELELLKKANPSPTTGAPAPPAELADTIVTGETLVRPTPNERRFHPLLVAVAAALTVIVGVGGLALATRNADQDVAGQTTVPSLTGNAAPDTTVVGLTTTAVPTVDPAAVPAESCSAADAEMPASDSSLPLAVAATRDAIARAAISCNFDALAALTTPAFTYSFGGGGQAAEYWREAESRGDDTLRTLVYLLSLPVTPETYEVDAASFDFERQTLSLRLDALGGLADSLSERVDGLGDALLAASSEDERFELAAELRTMEAALADLLTERGVIEVRLAELDQLDGSQTIFVWPPASGYDTWDDVPQPEKDQLRVLYDDADLESFGLFGSYVGYRVGITAGGTWTFLVAGD